MRRDFGTGEMTERAGVAEALVVEAVVDQAEILGQCSCSSLH